MARAPQSQSQPLYDDDGSGTEPDTPKPRRTGKTVRKRISEAYNPDQDGSFAEDNSGVNDDAAEKRRRRKSTRMTVPAKSAEGEEGGAGTSRANANKKLLDLPAVAPVVFNKDAAGMHLEYEQWMKIATENKISQHNTWEVALIDYFHDMSLLRNESDNSINFQRASCTLDGCIKIWTSRVDSVGTETAKLASNLASGRSGADDEDEDEDAGSDEERVEKKRKKSHRAVQTLVKDASQIKVKKLDLEFSVDPLFRKTCADFDEGGAQGLLMNHLSLGVGQDGNLRVVFDAGDSISKTEEEEEIEEEKEDFIDLTYLKSEFIPDLSALDFKAICHSLDDFSFTSNNLSPDDSTFYQDNTTRDDDDDGDDGDDFGVNFDMGGGPEPAEDFFTGNDAINDDFVGDPMMGGDDFDAPSPSSGEAGEGMGAEGAGPHVPFDPRQAPNRNDLVLAMGDDNDGSMMDYFDKAFMKNWAGPEHWKVRRPIRKVETDAPKEPKRKEKKEAYRINFLEPRTQEENEEIAKKLFAKPGKGVSINLPGTQIAGSKSKKKTTKDKEKRSDHRLPDDMHFSSQQLVTLFLKPKFELRMRGRGNARIPMNGDGELDQNYWAQATAEHEARNAMGGDVDETGPIPFATQFLDEVYDGPGFDDVDDGDDGVGPIDDPGEQDLLAASQGMPRRPKMEAVKHAKRAKRVDVRKLKENIWKGLDIIVPKKKENTDGDINGMDVDDEDDDVQLTEPTEAREFNGVISNLQTVYPPEKMRDISTSFCFICLLHLANEEGLKLENPTTDVGGDDDGEYEERKVGNIWDLKRHGHLNPITFSRQAQVTLFFIATTIFSSLIMEYPSLHQPHTFVVLLFGSKLIKVDLPKSCILTEFADRIFNSDGFELDAELRDIASRYKMRHLRYFALKKPFPIHAMEKIPSPQGLHNQVTEIIAEIGSTARCAGQYIPSDGSCLNLVIEEPLPIDQIPELAGKKPARLRAREVVQSLNKYKAEVYPYMGDKLMGTSGTSRIQYVANSSNDMKSMHSWRFRNWDLPPHRYPPFATTPLANRAIPHRYAGLWVQPGWRKRAVRFLHFHDMYHLDIKPANLTIRRESPDLTVIDLGWFEYGRGEPCAFASGTDGWVAPEIQVWHDYEEHEPGQA
ncbi:hypothetical protein V5O48_011153 [Marasmius crinis-equi]|uniref:Condensin complex subunit 2 n=1 Tax=Marasmius crinis-equi TaxID=585013 RepID=A0ABR3F6C6_9AGAR